METRLDKMLTIICDSKTNKVKVLNVHLAGPNKDILNSKFIMIENDIFGNLHCVNTEDHTIEVMKLGTTTWVPICRYKSLILE